MNRKILAIAFATVAAAALVGVSANGQTIRAAAMVGEVPVPSKVDNFRLVDQYSRGQDLYYYKNSKAVVIISQANGSKYFQDAAPAIKALHDKYASKDVVFLLINSSPDAKPDAVAAEMKKIGLDLPVMLDTTQLIGEGLGVSRTTQAFVIQPKGWTVAYTGPIDDRFAAATAKPSASAKTSYVADALDSLIAGKPVALTSAKIDSPALSFPKRDKQADFAKISYATEVAPIIEKNCVACHSEGGIGPFAMDSYEKVKGFAPMIREALRTDRMPPYNADPHVSTFRDSQNLSPAETQTLVHWIEAGAPRGQGEDLLKISAKAAPEWELGQPDLILNLPDFKIPASGVVDYQYPIVTVPVTETRWIRAVTFNVGNRQGVHHVVSPIGDYAVGAETAVYPQGQGVEVTPGQKVRPSVHYTPFGKEVTDSTRVGLYFYPKDKPPEVIRRTAVIANPALEIPPNAESHEVISYMTFPQEATLYSVYPHAHYRGQTAHVFLKKPGEAEKLIVSLPFYDFNWQRGYYFETPINLPKGTKIITRYTYNNSKNNPANPDPSITVSWGEQSWEEMQFTQVSFSWKDETTSNQKPEYMEALNNSRAIGVLDANIDGKIAKSEATGRVGQMILASFDKLDTDKDGFISESEAAALTPLLNRRVQAAEDTLKTGAALPKE